MLLSDIENAVEIVKLIRQLTQDEGDAIWFYNDNPPEPGGSNCKVSGSRHFNPPVHFFGESVLYCLQTAKRKRDLEDEAVKRGKS